MIKPVCKSKLGIYSYEFIHFYGVKNLVRIGSCGLLQENVKIRDIVIGMSASIYSNFAEQFNLTGTFAPSASWELLEKAVAIAHNKKTCKG